MRELRYVDFMLKKSKIILVTGSSGFIGFHLCQSLLGNDFTVIGVDGMTNYYDVNLKVNRRNQLLKKSNFHSFEGLIEKKGFIADICNEFKPEVVVHLAAQAGVRYSIESPLSYVDSNLIGTFNVIEAARNYNISHLLVASSSSVYGSNKEMPFDELQKCDTPLSFYAATKKANEVMCHSYSHLYSIPITMLRFFTAYGPWGRPDMALFKFTEAILKNKKIDVYNNGKMKRDFTYISDLVQSIKLLIDVIPELPVKRIKSINGDSISDVAPWRVINIGSSDPVELLEFIKVIEKSLGMEANKNMLNMQPGDVEVNWASTNLLKELTKFTPSTSISSGVDSFIKWYLEYV